MTDEPCEKENLNTTDGKIEPGLEHPDVEAAKIAAKTVLPSLIPSPFGVLRLVRSFIK